jgi:Tfp pilus assembly protein PilZ
VSGAENRQHERVPTSGVAIRVKFNDVAQLEQYFLRDISRGGVFLRAKNIKALHEQLYVVLALPDGNEVKLRGEVVHVVTPAEASPNRPSGMGVQFLDLTPEIKQQLESYIARLKQPAPSEFKNEQSSVSGATYEEENDQALLRRLCWLLSEGSVLGRPAKEIFGISSSAPAELRREVYDRFRKALAPEKAPRYLGAEEARAISRLLAMLESMARED